MTNYHFNALRDHEKAEAAWSGAFIGDREDAVHNILLYQINSFYVEVYHHKETNTITRFGSFTTTDLLDPYLGQIDLLPLFNT